MSPSTFVTLYSFIIGQYESADSSRNKPPIDIAKHHNYSTVTQLCLPTNNQLIVNDSTFHLHIPIPISLMSQAGMNGFEGGVIPEVRVRSVERC